MSLPNVLSIELTDVDPLKESDFIFSPSSKSYQTLVPIFGTNSTVFVDFKVSKVEYHPAELDAGFPHDYYEATDVDVLRVDLAPWDSKDVITINLADIPVPVMEILVDLCLTMAAKNPDLARELADADADRRYESMMEDRWEREIDP